MMAKTPEKLYQERIKRILDVVALKEPDRVPIFGPYEAFPYYYYGVTLKEAMNDYEMANEVCHKFVDEFEPDADFGPILAYPAKPMETLGNQVVQVGWTRTARQHHVPVRRR